MWSNIISKAGETNEQRRRIDGEEFWNKVQIALGGSKMEKKSLEVGEKYLSIQIEVGGVTQRFAAFKNKVKKNPLEPEYKGQNVAVWITSKKMPKETNKVEDI